MRIRSPIARKLPAAAVVVAFALTASATMAGTLIPVPPVPGSTFTYVNGINDQNVIAGQYVTPGGGTHGYFGPLDGQYTSFDAPMGGTAVGGINNADYITVLSDYQTDDCRFIGCQYLRKPDGSFAAIEKAGTRLDGIPGGITAHQRFVGWYFAEDGSGVYGYYGHGTKYASDLTLPFQTDVTMPADINSRGTVVGSFSDATTREYVAFIVSDGTASAIQYPDPAATNTWFDGVNHAGKVSGFWKDQAGFFHAFLYDPLAVTFAPIDVHGATSVIAGAINRQGVVALDVDGSPYVYCTRSKTCPFRSAAGISIPEKWIRVPPSNMRTALCRNNCVGPHHAMMSMPRLAKRNGTPLVAQMNASTLEERAPKSLK
jgi:hypothetical protein